MTKSEALEKSAAAQSHASRVGALYNQGGRASYEERAAARAAAKAAYDAYLATPGDSRAYLNVKGLSYSSWLSMAGIAEDQFLRMPEEKRERLLWEPWNRGNNPENHNGKGGQRAPRFEPPPHVDTYVEPVEAEAEETVVRPLGAPWNGFLVGMTPMAASKAAAVLERTVAFGGQVGRRGDHIERLVERGYTVSEDGLSSREGTFYDPAAVTKTGLAYAAYLIASQQAQGSLF